MLPSLPPLHAIASPLLVCDTVTELVSKGGSLSVTLALAWQPFRSVTLIVYVPALKFVRSSEAALKPLGPLHAMV